MKEIELSYKEGEFKNFLITCNNVLKDRRYVRIETSLIPLKENLVRILFHSYVYDNQSILVSFYDFEDSEFFKYVSKLSERYNRTFGNLRSRDILYLEFELREKLSTEKLLESKFYLIEEDNKFRLEVKFKDNIVCSLKESKPIDFQGFVPEFLETYNIFNLKEDYIVTYRSFLRRIKDNLYDLIKTYDNSTLIINSSKISIYKDSKFTDLDYSLKNENLFASINTKIFDLFLDFMKPKSFFIPNTCDNSIILVSEYVGGFYLFVQDAKISFNRSITIDVRQQRSSLNPI